MKTKRTGNLMKSPISLQKQQQKTKYIFSMKEITF